MHKYSLQSTWPRTKNSPNGNRHPNGARTPFGYSLRPKRQRSPSTDPRKRLSTEDLGFIDCGGAGYSGCVCFSSNRTTRVSQNEPPVSESSLLVALQNSEASDEVP